MPVSLEHLFENTMYVDHNMIHHFVHLEFQIMIENFNHFSKRVKHDCVEWYTDDYCIYLIKRHPLIIAAPMTWCLFE